MVNTNSLREAERILENYKKKTYFYLEKFSKIAPIHDFKDIIIKNFESHSF